MSFSSDQPQIINQLPSTINLPTLPNGGLFRDALEDIIRNVASTVNTKEGGLYTQVEQGASTQYYTQTQVSPGVFVTDPTTFRNVYRKVLNFVNLNSGNIPGGATLIFPHGITGVQQSATIMANCTATNNQCFTVVYPNVYIDQTNAYFTNPQAVPLSQADIIINVLKQV